MAPNPTGARVRLGTATGVEAMDETASAARVLIVDSTGAIIGASAKFAKISASSNGDNTIVAAVAAKKIRVLRVNLVSNGTVNVKWQSGASGTDLTGLAYLIANTGYVEAYCEVGLFETAVNTLLNLNLSGAVAVGGSITYVEV